MRTSLLVNWTAGLIGALAALIAAQPDRTLAELRAALDTPASVPTIWRAVHALGLTVKTNGAAVRTRAT